MYAMKRDVMRKTRKWENILYYIVYFLLEKGSCCIFFITEYEKMAFVISTYSTFCLSLIFSSEIPAVSVFSGYFCIKYDDKLKFSKLPSFIPCRGLRWSLRSNSFRKYSRIYNLDLQRLTYKCFNHYSTFDHYKGHKNYQITDKTEKRISFKKICQFTFNS